MSETDMWRIEILVNGAIGLVTLAALIVALVQVKHARDEATAARLAVATERRLTFELQLLSQMYDQWSTTNTAHLSGYINALVRDPTDEEDLPLLRAATGAKPTGRARALLDQFPRSSEEFNNEVRRELDDAISRRIEEASHGLRPRT